MSNFILGIISVFFITEHILSVKAPAHSKSGIAARSDATPKKENDITRSSANINEYIKYVPVIFINCFAIIINR